MIWRDYLTPEESARLEAIPAARRALTREYKAIFERCRKRAERAGTKMTVQTPFQQPPQTRRKARP